MQKTERKPRRIIILLLLAMLAVSFALPIYTHAAPAQDAVETDAIEGGAFEVTNLDIKASVNKDHSYDIEETISVNIPDAVQSAEFVLPSGNFKLSGVEVEGFEHSLNQSTNSNTLVISDAKALEKGSHVYTVKYRIQEYAEKDRSKDIFFFNILPPEWSQPIGQLSIAVNFPDDFPWDDLQCYAGQLGVQDVTNKITFKTKKSTHSASIKGSMVPENFGITLKAQLEDGYWEDALSGDWAVLAVVISMSAVLLLLAIFWFIGGRDPKVAKEKGINGPIEDLPAPELGYALNQKMSIRSILLLIVQFASRGYLRISEYEPKMYRLYKLQKPDDEERVYRKAYDILFEDVYRGRYLEMDELVRRLGIIRQSIEDDVAARYPGSDSLAFTPLSRILRYLSAGVLAVGIALSIIFSYMYGHQPANFSEAAVTGIATGLASILLCRVIDGRDSSAENSRRLLTILSAILFAIPVLHAAYRSFANTQNFILPIFILLASALSAFLIYVMRSRGSENAVRVARIRQLRSFIYHPTPKELLENHLADEDYYYDMLIYALALGAEESWAISFLTLDVEEPEWFTDDVEGHTLSNLRENRTTIDYARDIRSFIRTTENAYIQRNESR